MSDLVRIIEAALLQRFGVRVKVDKNLAGLDELSRIAAHRVHRRFLPREVDPDLLRLLCACALSAPSKSDLQQADILIIRENAKRHSIADLLSEMPWVREAPVFLVFLANGRRLTQLSEMRGKPFPNDHLDLFFNATVDAAIVMMTFIRGAEAAGLGCCPISVIRDHATRIAALLKLPSKVVPVAGMCVGWPAEAGSITPRLPLTMTIHEDVFSESNLAAAVEDYDRRRENLRPYRNQRDPERFGRSDSYGWSEDKARQYAVPLRTDFGAFVRAQGFRLD